MCFVLVIHCLIFKVLRAVRLLPNGRLLLQFRPVQGVSRRQLDIRLSPKSVDITSGRSKRPPFRLSPKPPLVAGCCFVSARFRGCLADSFDIISLSFPFVNPFFQIFSNFLKVFFDTVFAPKSCASLPFSPLGLVLRLPPPCANCPNRDGRW